MVSYDACKACKWGEGVDDALAFVHGPLGGLAFGFGEALHLKGVEVDVHGLAPVNANDRGCIVDVVAVTAFRPYAAFGYFPGDQFYCVHCVGCLNLIGQK